MDFDRRDSPGDRALRLLRADRRLAGPAAFPFNFDLDRAEHGEEVRLASGGPLEPVAGDDTGGTYFVCGDGSVLYADSEGSAGIIGDTVDQALEVLIGLPGWLDCLDLSPDDGTDRILARVNEVEAEIREYHPVDEDRTALRAALGLPERSPVELVGMLHSALLRTEPEFLLLNAEEHGAYQLLDRHPRPALRDLLNSEPPDDSLFTCTALARAQGLTEAARVALIRALDVIDLRAYRKQATDPADAADLRLIISEFEALGDDLQAGRARALYVPFA